MTPMQGLLDQFMHFDDDLASWIHTIGYTHYAIYLDFYIPGQALPAEVDHFLCQPAPCEQRLMLLTPAVGRC